MITCPNCKGSVNESARVCPKCDFPLNDSGGKGWTGSGALKVVKIGELMTPEQKERDDERTRVRNDIEKRVRESVESEVEWERSERIKAERKYEEFRQECADNNDLIERLRDENELLRQYGKIMIVAGSFLFLLMLVLCIVGFSKNGQKEKELVEVRPFRDMYYSANMNSRRIGSERDSLRAAFLDLKDRYDSLISDTSRAPSLHVSATPRARGERANIPIDMVRVEGGTFKMGCTPEQGADCGEDEMPPRDVTVNSFSIAKYPVTQGLWRQVMESNPSKYRNDDHPVEQVSWRDANEFIGRLNQLTGRRYRLPTEAEWEYAARGGANSRGFKFSGSNSVDEVAWFARSSGTGAVSETRRANELGIRDMSGNVREWVSDRYGPYGENAVTNPAGPATGNERVVRGGGWTHGAGSCRVSARAAYPSGAKSSYIGFRLASN